MNIFVLSEIPSKAAQYHNDTHLVKMILESCQLLSNVCFFIEHEKQPKDFTKEYLTEWKEKNGLYMPTHFNHPCSIWARKTRDNFRWLKALTRSLLNEYKYRKDKEHKSCKVMLNIDMFIFNNIDSYKRVLDEKGLTAFALAMPDYCKVENDAIASYRKYYNEEKQGYFMKGKFIPYKWTVRQQPEWFKRKTHEQDTNK